MDDNGNKMQRGVLLASIVVLVCVLLWLVGAIQKLRNSAPAPTITGNNPTVAVKSQAETTKAPTKAPTQAPKKATPTPKPTPKPKEFIIFDDEHATIKYEELYETPPAFNDNNWLLRVYVTNKTDQEILFCFKDASINDEMVSIISAYNVLPHKSGRFLCTVMVESSMLSISSIKDLKEFEFSVQILDSDWNDVITPYTVKLNYKNGEVEE